MGFFDRKQPPPPKKKADFSNVQSGKSTSAPLPAPAPAPPAKVARTYTVVSGDSLSKIAKKHLGNANRWNELYELNRAVVGDNPNLIKPGQVLTLPEVPTATAPATTPAAKPATIPPAKKV